MNPKIIIDTREQLPLDFSRSRTFDTIGKKLDVGDYGLEVDGVLQPFIFERKSLGDLCGTLTSGHARFKSEIDRALSSNKILIVIIEGSYSDLITNNFKSSFRSKIKGYVVAKICHTLFFKYNIQFVFCQDRTESSRYIQDFFSSYLKNKQIFV